MSDDMSDPRERIQMLAGQLQNTMQQVQTVDTQIREIQATISALEVQNESRPVYRQIGPLLLEVEDRNLLKDELASSMETLSEHLQKIQQSETEIRELYEQAINSFESQ
ncbi:MAG: prefoldin subunit [Candidatus Thalassarchaeaceae archaeon]